MVSACQEIACFDVLNRLHSVLCNLDASLFSHFILVGDFNDFLSPNWPLYDKLLSVMFSVTVSCH